MTFPPLHIIEPQTSHTHTAILLHGRGSNGPEFAEDLFSSNTSQGQNLPSHFPSWRWVFPTSKDRWSAVFEEDITAWFDVYSLTDISARQDLQTEGLRESMLYIFDQLEKEVDLLGGQAEKVVLGGMSQGMATALWTLLCHPVLPRQFKWDRLGAFIGFCGWLPFANEVEENIRNADGDSAADEGAHLCLKTSRFLLDSIDYREVDEDTSLDNVKTLHSTPVSFVHDTDDPLVDVELARQAHRVLNRMGIHAELIEHSGADNEGHWIKEPEGFDFIVTFLNHSTNQG